MHSGDEPVGLCDTGLRAVVYCLIVFNVRFYCVRFLCSLFNSACAIKDCFAHFACAQFATAVGYGFANARRLIAAVLLLTHLREQECSQKCVALICSLFLSPVSGCRQGSSPSRTPSHPIGRSFSRRASRCRSILASLLF